MTFQLDKNTLTKRFSELTEGNWRNSFYIDCSACPYERPEGCGDFLFVPDETGRPAWPYRLERMPGPHEQLHVPGALPPMAEYQDT